MFEIIEKEPTNTIIKVIGVGGAGGNAVEHMIRENVQGVEFICANTDAQALSRSQVKHKLQLGKTGLGAGAKPEVGKAAAESERERIADALRGSHMVFITAGMGGGTGTGAAPVVAQVAREMGILTVGVVTKPFGFEGKRMKIADAGLAELAKNVDSLIVILNERLMEVLGDDASMQDGFKAADNVLRNAVGGIAEIINFPGLVNVDFEDVRTVMGEMGMAMMGSAVASGMDRARIAAEQAVASPLLEGVHLSGARGVLVNITASSNLKMKEVHEVMNTIKAFADPEAEVIFGAVFDENMADELRVTVVATGLGAVSAKQAKQPNISIVPQQRTGTDGLYVSSGTNYAELDVPAVMRSGRGGAARASANTQVQAMAASGMPTLDIPAFLRKQAD